MTIVYLEGFEHQYEGVDFFDTTHGVWTAVAGIGQISYPSGRTGLCARFVMDGLADRRLISTDLAIATDHNVGAMYIRVPSAPSVTSNFFDTATSGGAATTCRFQITTGGAIQGSIGGFGTVVGPVVSDNNWHRIDWDADTSTTTHTLNWAVDGVNQTSAVRAGQTAGVDSVRVIYGSSNTTHTLTIDIDDVVISDDAAQYKINGGQDYNVGTLAVTGDGTHNAGVNVMEDQAGTDIVSPNAFPLINETPPEETDYIRQVAIGAGNYAEVTFADTTHDNLLAVCGVVGGGASNATSPNGTIRVVDSGGSTLVDLFSGNMGGGSTANRIMLARVPDPGGDGWTNGELNGLKLRVGFSTNASGAVTPKWTLGMLYFAYGADLPVGSGGTLDPFGMSGFFGG